VHQFDADLKAHAEGRLRLLKNEQISARPTAAKFVFTARHRYITPQIL
jgi:hypothetical protein